MTSEQTEQQAIDCFRRLVSMLYREIGMLLPQNHEEIAAKRNLTGQFFPTKRKEIAASLYKYTVSTTESEDIVAPYVEVTGLTLEDVERAFREGDWRDSRGRYSFGGPKWARIAQATLTIESSINEHDHERQIALMKQIETLEHNNGKIADKLRQLG